MIVAGGDGVAHGGQHAERVLVGVQLERVRGIDPGAAGALGERLHRVVGGQGGQFGAQGRGRGGVEHVGA